MHAQAGTLTAKNRAVSLGLGHHGLSCGREAPQGLCIVFFKVIALILAAAIGYYTLDGAPEQFVTFVLLPLSSIAVIMLLGTSG